MYNLIRHKLSHNLLCFFAAEERDRRNRSRGLSDMERELESLSMSFNAENALRDRNDRRARAAKAGGSKAVNGSGNSARSVAVPSRPDPAESGATSPRSSALSPPSSAEPVTEPGTPPANATTKTTLLMTSPIDKVQALNAKNKFDLLFNMRLKKQQGLASVDFGSADPGSSISGSPPPKPQDVLAAFSLLLGSEDV